MNIRRTKEGLENCLIALMIFSGVAVAINLFDIVLPLFTGDDTEVALRLFPIIVLVVCYIGYLLTKKGTRVAAMIDLVIGVGAFLGYPIMYVINEDYFYLFPKTYGWLDWFILIPGIIMIISAIKYLSIKK